MTLSPTLLIVVWVWIAIGLFAVGLAVWGLGKNAASNSDWGDAFIGFLVFFGGLGLTVLGLAATGLAVLSLYFWRVGAILGVFLVPLYFLVRFLKKARPLEQAPSSTPAVSSPPKIPFPMRWTLALATVFMVAHAILAFQQGRMMRFDGPAAQPAELGTPVWTAQQMSTALWTVSIVLLAVGTGFFLLLFVNHVERGGRPQLENNWGGIGGGLGGWRMSSSLSYLLVAAVFAILFTVFLLQFDRRRREEKPDLNDMKTQTKSSSQTTPSPTPIPTPTPRPESKEASSPPKA